MLWCCVCTWVCAHECRCPQSIEEPDLPELQLQAVMNCQMLVLGSKESSGRGVSVLNHQAIPLAPKMPTYFITSLAFNLL